MFIVFFFNDTAPPEIYTLSLHDALPISPCKGAGSPPGLGQAHLDKHTWTSNLTRRANQRYILLFRNPAMPDRKSTRLNSSHVRISYAVFCLKKKKKTKEK